MSNNTLEFSINLNGNAYSGIAQINNALNKVNISASKTTSLMDKITDATFKINNIVGGIQNTIGKVFSVVQKVIDVGSEDELQKLNLTTLFRGNAEAAEDMYNKVSQYSIDSVYDKKGLLDAVNTMMQYQVSGEKAFETIKQIGDIAMGSSTKMQSLALAFAQASSKGKLDGNEYRQMVSHFNPLLALIEKEGGDIAFWEQEISKGAVSIEKLSQAFRWATEEGGAFYKGAENAANTIPAKINALEEKISVFLISVFGKLRPIINQSILFAINILEYLPPLLDDISVAVSGVVGWFAEFMPIIAGVTTAMGILAVACNTTRISLLMQEGILNILIIKEKAVTIATKLWASAQAAFNAVMALNPIILIIAGVVTFIGVITYLCYKIQGWGTLWDGICGFMKHTFFAIVENIKSRWITMVNNLMIGLDIIKLGWYKFKKACGLGDNSENQSAIAKIHSDIEARKKAITDGAKKVAEHEDKAVQALKGINLSWGSSEEEKSPAEKLGTNSQLQSMVSASAGGTASTSGMSSLKSSNEAIATGGTRNTSITINLGEMIGSVSFNGGIEDNREDFERKLAESMFRVLAIAQSSVG